MLLSMGEGKEQGDKLEMAAKDQTTKIPIAAVLIDFISHYPSVTPPISFTTAGASSAESPHATSLLLSPASIPTLSNLCVRDFYHRPVLNMRLHMWAEHTWAGSLVCATLDRTFSCRPSLAAWSSLNGMSLSPCLEKTSWGSPITIFADCLHVWRVKMDWNICKRPQQRSWHFCKQKPSKRNVQPNIRFLPTIQIRFFRRICSPEDESIYMLSWPSIHWRTSVS